jgi:predicted component of type VI protein secretion system
MSVKLKVSKPSPRPWFHEYEYDQDLITIGRSVKNDLQLEGINGVVSREHAKIIRKSESYVLVDLNSINTTLLNGEKLKSNVEYDLRPGDRFQICDYEIEFVIEKKMVLEEPRPQPAPPPRSNPFLQDLTELARILDKVALIYELDESPGKNEDMYDALQKALKESRGKEAVEILGGYLGGDRAMPTVAMLGKDSSELDILSNYERVRDFIDATVEFLTKLIQARVKFRQEFLNETIVKSKSFSLDSCTPEELKGFLFDAKLSPGDGLKRTEALAVVLEELLLHQLSLLEGYKAGVNEGTKRLLDRMNPVRLSEQLAEKKIHLGVVEIPVISVPILKLSKLIQIYNEVYRELTTEDQAVIEERYFRPSYKRSYYNCSRASRRKPSKAEKRRESPR